MSEVSTNTLIMSRKPQIFKKPLDLYNLVAQKVKEPFEITSRIHFLRNSTTEEGKNVLKTRWQQAIFNNGECGLECFYFALDISKNYCTNKKRMIFMTRPNNKQHAYD